MNKSNKPPVGKSIEDLMHDQRQKESVPADKVSLMTSLMKMSLSASSNPEALRLKRIMEIYEKVPDLAAEFSGYLKSKTLHYIPVQPALDLLKEVTSLNRGVYTHEMAFYLEADMHPMMKSKSTIFKLLNSANPHKLKWFFDPASPEVYGNDAVNPYEDSIFHSFSNCMARQEQFEIGKVHVAVGFVDFSILLWMNLIDGNDKDSKPFHFIGFEMSAYSIAKGLVISVMLRKNDPGIIDAILQVWYSSCWSTSTLKIFLASIDDAKVLSADKKVSALLDYWKCNQAPSVRMAREKWLEKISHILFDPAVNCLKLRARKILIQYFLTGQLLPASVGSVTMFQLPDGYVGRSRDESFFHSIDIGVLAESTKGCDGDFVAGAVSLLRQKISRLKDRIDADLVKITVIGSPTNVSLKNPNAIEKIRMICPYTISWNNCLDYMPYKDFHRLARACSAPEDTVHYGYSMNWCTNVKNSSCLCHPPGQHMEVQMKEMRNVLKIQNDLLGMGDLLITPPIDSPINILDMAYRQLYRDKWIKMFFHAAPNVGQIEPSLYSNFARSNGTVFFIWSYDEEIRFNFIERA